jgi:two-component system chemotaxis response regulator CheB
MSTPRRTYEFVPHPQAKNRFKIVVIGSSAGGISAIHEILQRLPADFPCPILIVHHLSSQYRSHLAEIFTRNAQLTVKEAEDGEKITAGVVYIAPPDHHLVTQAGRILLTNAPAIRHLRPSVDTLFEAVAAEYGPACIAVVLSGCGRDGSEGLIAVRKAGGYTVVEDPAGAEFGFMPTAAIATECADAILPPSGIAEKLISLGRRGDASPTAE